MRTPSLLPSPALIQRSLTPPSEIPSPKCVLTEAFPIGHPIFNSLPTSQTPTPSLTPLPLSLGTPNLHLSPTLGENLLRGEVSTSPLYGIAVAHPTPPLHSPRVQLRPSGEGKTRPPLNRTLPSSPPPSEGIDGEPLELAPVKLNTDFARTSPTPDKSSLLFSLDGEPLEPPANKGRGEWSKDAEPVQKPLEELECKYEGKTSNLELLAQNDSNSTTHYVDKSKASALGINSELGFTEHTNRSDTTATNISADTVMSTESELTDQQAAPATHTSAEETKTLLSPSTGSSSPRMGNNTTPVTTAASTTAPSVVHCPIQMCLFGETTSAKIGEHLRESHRGKKVLLKDLEDIGLVICPGTCGMPFADLSLHQTGNGYCKPLPTVQRIPEGITMERWQEYESTMQRAPENNEGITHTKEGIRMEGSVGIMFADIIKAWRKENSVDEEGYITLGGANSDERKKRKPKKKSKPKGKSQLLPPPPSCPFCFTRPFKSGSDWQKHMVDHMNEEIGTRIRENMNDQEIAKCEKCRHFTHASIPHPNECKEVNPQKSKGEAESSLRKMKSAQPKEKRTCSLCQSSFASQRQYTQHACLRDQPKEKEERVRPTCPWCDHRIIDRRSLCAHLNKEHARRRLSEDEQGKLRILQCPVNDCLIFLTSMTRHSKSHGVQGEVVPSKRPEVSKQDTMGVSASTGARKSDEKGGGGALENGEHLGGSISTVAQHEGDRNDLKGKDQRSTADLNLKQVNEKSLTPESGDRRIWLSQPAARRFNSQISAQGGQNLAPGADLKQQAPSQNETKLSNTQAHTELQRQDEDKTLPRGKGSRSRSVGNVALRNSCTPEDKTLTTRRRSTGAREGDSTGIDRTASTQRRVLSNDREAVRQDDHKHLRRSVSLGEDGRDRKKESSLTLATAQDILNASHPLRLTTQMSIDSFVVEVQDDDEEMKQTTDVKHVPYVPHLWRSVPEYLWGLWWDICRPKLTAFQVAHHRRDRRSMDSAVSELLSIPAHTLRRIRGGKNIQKSHLGLEQQLRQIAITSIPLAGSERDGKTEGKVPSAEAETVQDSKEAQRVQKATTLVHEGHTRRAVRCLLSEGVPTISEKVIEDLRKLHPPGPSILPTCPHDAPTVLNVDKEVIKDIVIKELANGAAPGRSGWTGDLLKALVYDEQCLAGLTTLTMAIVNGELKGRAKTLLLSSVLIGLPKPNGGTRPIAMGEIFYKLAGAYMLRLVKEPAREALGSAQFAFAPGGAEAAVLCLRTALLEHPTWCIMACDIKNAFNARNRYQILETLYQHKELNAVWKIANWAYGEPSDLLVVDKGKLVEVIKSSQGVKQGDTLSSLLFALSMTRLYNGTAEQTMVKVIAVQDDVYFLGPQDAVMAAWKHFNAEVAKKTGLEINRQKTGVLVPSGTVVTRLREEGLQSSEVSIQALGTIHKGYASLERLA